VTRHPRTVAYVIASFKSRSFICSRLHDSRLRVVSLPFLGLLELPELSVECLTKTKAT
jgi:hypothetical protein